MPVDAAGIRLRLARPCVLSAHITGGKPVSIQALPRNVHGQLAQLDRALASGAKGRAFESRIAHH